MRRPRFSQSIGRPAGRGNRDPARSGSNGAVLRAESEARPLDPVAPLNEAESSQFDRRAKDGKVTQTLVRDVIAEMSPKGLAPVSAPKTRGEAKSKSKIPLGQILSLLQEARRRIEKRETEEAIAALERIETLIFGVDSPVHSN